jgi:tetratricopeptide (TPR) repeat protein
MNLVRDFPIIIVSLITFFYFSIGILLANKSKLDLKIFALLGYATSVLVIVILFYSPLKQFLTKAANETTNREIFEVPYIISSLIIVLYFLIVFLYSKKEKVEFRSFVSLGYATSILIAVILFYSPVKNLLMRTARDATNIEIGNTKIVLPIVAIHHKKNYIIKNAIEYEKENIKDTTTKIKNLKYVIEFIKLDIDIMKCKVDNFIIQNKSSEILISKIECYEEVLNKLVTHILPLIDNGEFENAFEKYKKIDSLWGNEIRLNVPYYYTALGLLYSSINNSEKCSEIFKKAIKIFPNDVLLLHFNAGACLTEKSDLIDAIHYTRLAMAVLEDHLYDFANELNKRSELINKMILSANDKEMPRIIRIARSLNSKKLIRPEDYDRITTAAINFWKYRLAYWYSLVRLEEYDARKYANEIEQYMIDKNDVIPTYTDAIGLVKLVFAKNINDIEEAKEMFEKAKKAAESSSAKYKNTLNRINLHLSLVDDVLKA